MTRLAGRVYNLHIKATCVYMHVHKQDTCTCKHTQKLILACVPYGIELVADLYRTISNGNYYGNNQYAYVV